MERDYLIKYVEFYNKEEKDVTTEDYRIKYAVENDPGYREFVKNIQATSSPSRRLELVDEFLKQKEFNNKSEDEKIKEAIEKEFGIDLTNIEHMKLQSGIDIIAFYDEKLGRKRLVDYTYAKSLVTEFTNIQNNNVNFQGNDFEKNTNEIVKSEANKNSNKELNMIDIERAKSEYFDLINRIDNQDPTKIQCVNELIKNAESRRIKWINFEKMVALDEDGNIIESFYNEKDNKFEIETPEKIDVSVNSIDNKEKVEESIYNNDIPNNDINENEEQDVSIEPTDYEESEKIEDAELMDMLNESMSIYHINCTKEEFYHNVIKYSNNMDALEDDYNKNNITKEEYDCYMICSQKYIDIKKAKLENKKVKTLEYSSNNRGIISVFIISILAIILGLIALLLKI